MNDHSSYCSKTEEDDVKWSEDHRLFQAVVDADPAQVAKYLDEDIDVNIVDENVIKSFLLYHLFDLPLMKIGINTSSLCSR